MVMWESGVMLCTFALKETFFLIAAAAPSELHYFSKVNHIPHCLPYKCTCACYQYLFSICFSQSPDDFYLNIRVQFPVRADDVISNKTFWQWSVHCHAIKNKIKNCAKQEQQVLKCSEKYYGTYESPIILVRHSHKTKHNMITEIMYQSNQSLNIPPPSPGNPPGIWIFGEYLFKFPPPEAEKLFKCSIIGPFQVIKCPHPWETFP